MDATDNTALASPSDNSAPDISPFTALAEQRLGEFNPYRRQGIIDGIINYFRRQDAIQQEGQMLAQVNQHIQSSMAAGMPMEQAMMEAFKANPMFMLAHPDLFESASRLRAAIAPAAQSPMNRYVDSAGNTVAAPTPGDVQYVPAEGETPGYFVTTEPSGIKHVAQAFPHENFVMAVRPDGSIVTMDKKKGPESIQTIPGAVDPASTAFERELNATANEMQQSGVPADQIAQWRLKMRQDRITKLSQQTTNPFAQFFQGMAGGAPGAPAPAPGVAANPTAPQNNSAATGAIARPQTQEDFTKLPSGAHYINPSDGKVYVKK